jgi:DNA-binding NarL/FixJ family response regulator
MKANFKVVGEVADGFKVVDLVERLKPRLLIVALAMPGLNGLEITRRVRQQSPATAVIVLSMYSKDQYVLTALRNGACGYVVTRAEPAELVRAIRKGAAGSRYLSEPLSRRRDLTETARGHLYGCALLPSEVRLKAQQVREAAQRLVKQSQQARDRSDLLLREAEAALFERQEALRTAMRKSAQN